MQKLFAAFLVLLTITYGKKKANQDLEKYVAASTEDLARVFEMEKEMWKIVKEYQKKDATKKDELIIQNFINETRFEQICDEVSLKHVAHPMNAFQALKRTTKTWEETLLKLEKQSKLKKAKQILRRFPERIDFEEGAAFGLMTLQLYYDIAYQVSILLQTGRKRRFMKDQSNVKNEIAENIYYTSQKLAMIF